MKNWTDSYFEFNLTKEEINSSISNIDFSFSNYKGFKIEFQKGTTLKAGNTIEECIYNATLYNNGLIGKEGDDEEQINWYKKAVELGDVRSMVAIGKVYENKNYDDFLNNVEAIKWYEKAANLNYGEAFKKIGDKYYLGRGVTKDCNLAISFYEKAINSGYFNSYTDLAELYESSFQNPCKSKSKAKEAREKYSNSFKK